MTFKFPTLNYIFYINRKTYQAFIVTFLLPNGFSISLQLLLLNSSSYSISCDIIAHPMPYMKHIFWKMTNGDYINFDPMAPDQTIIKQVR